MGMSTSIVGFRPPDEKWMAMKTVYDACIKAKVPVPDEVEDFFNGDPPDKQGVKVNLEDTAKAKIGAVTPWRDDSREGFEVNVTKLPKDVTIIRFYNSW